MKTIFRIILLSLTAQLMLSCISDPVKYTEQMPVNPSRLPPAEQVETTPIDPTLVADETGNMNDPYGLFRKRIPLPKNYGRYEGSLWNGDSSFGNFLRGNRAMSQGDLLKVTEIQNNITNFEEQEVAVAEDETSDITDIFKIGEAERLKVHKSIETMVVRVVKVGRNGLMAIYGEKTEYKDSNNVRFRSLLKGYIRPEDITEENTVPADLIQSFDFQTERKVRLTDVYKKKIIESVNKAENLTAENGSTTENQAGEQQVQPTSETDANADATQQVSANN